MEAVWDTTFETLFKMKSAKHKTVQLNCTRLS